MCCGVSADISRPPLEYSVFLAIACKNKMRTLAAILLWLGLLLEVAEVVVSPPTAATSKRCSKRRNPFQCQLGDLPRPHVRMDTALWFCTRVSYLSAVAFAAYATVSPPKDWLFHLVAPFSVAVCVLYIGGLAWGGGLKAILRMSFSCGVVHVVPAATCAPILLDKDASGRPGACAISDSVAILTTLCVLYALAWVARMVRGLWPYNVFALDTRRGNVVFVSCAVLVCFVHYVACSGLS